MAIANTNPQEQDTFTPEAAPGGFVRIDHRTPSGYFHPEDGVVVTIHERDRLTAAPRDYDRPWRVIMAQNQRGLHDSVHASPEDASRRAMELVASYVDAHTAP